MKKVLLGLVSAAALATFTSCDNTVLTAGLAEDALKKDVYWDNPVQTAQFTVGYYEVDLDKITSLQQLQAAGMITFSADKAVEAKKRYSWRGNYYEYIDHYFVNVALTEKGQKLVLTDEIKRGREDYIKDMKLDDESETKVPEYMTNYPDVKINTLQPDPSVQQNEGTDVGMDDTPVYNPDDEFQPDNASADKPAEKSAYEKAVAKISSEIVNVITGEYDIVKAKEVYCPEEYAKVGKGECKVIIEFTGKTPFGYVLGAPEEGQRNVNKIELKRYEDLGWVVVE